MIDFLTISGMDLKYEMLIEYLNEIIYIVQQVNIDFLTKKFFVIFYNFYIFSKIHTRIKEYLEI
jgi:hypothetical protein